MIVTLEVAKLAKEKGFDQNPYTAIYANSNAKGYYSEFIDGSGKITLNGALFNLEHIIAIAPTQSELQDWLRENHFLWTELTVFGDGIGVSSMLKKADPNDKEDDGSRIVRVEKIVDEGMWRRLEFDYKKSLENLLKEALNTLKSIKNKILIMKTLFLIDLKLSRCQKQEVGKLHQHKYI